MSPKPPRPFQAEIIATVFWSIVAISCFAGTQTHSILWKVMSWAGALAAALFVSSHGERAWRMYRDGTR